MQVACATELGDFRGCVRLKSMSVVVTGLQMCKKNGRFKEKRCAKQPL
jgi:hypothetical protein